ncbi:hypothetical protein [Flavobacterium tegetincola]|uniref:hypothetical protein n=1 Tax=Flavobacterium tegetincola TaxID=150172 RepID=UPI000413B567|nr:hypothetical protein [Flavobacterium tegetincola]
MVEELIGKYKIFHDATIEKISYSCSLNDECTMVLIMNAFNHENDFKYEKIEITLIEVLSFRLIEAFPLSALIITCAIFKEEDNNVTVDFFPDIYSDKLVVNELSDFIVKCKGIRFKNFIDM